jgi:single-strand DNA-binding protein
MKTREYEKDGQKRYLTELVVDSMELLTPKGEGGGQPQTQATPAPQNPLQEDKGDLPF